MINGKDQEIITINKTGNSILNKGFADVTGYIRKSNYAYHEPQYRVFTPYSCLLSLTQFTFSPYLVSYII